MKTRYQLLQDAGDTLDTLIKQLVVLRETGLAEDAEQLQNRLSEIAENAERDQDLAEIEEKESA
jgi:cbb3-type cytochrome oxidase cytochrome c subunit